MVNPDEQVHRQEEGEAERTGWAHWLGLDCVCHTGCSLGPHPSHKWKPRMSHTWICLQRNNSTSKAENKMRRLLRAPLKLDEETLDPRQPVRVEGR